MRGRKPSLTIVLTPADRAEIERRQRSATGPAGSARRGRALLMLEQGRAMKATAALCGPSARHVRKWAERHRRDRLAGLRGRPGAGREPASSPRGGVAPGQDGLRAAR